MDLALCFTNSSSYFMSLKARKFLCEVKFFALSSHPFRFGSSHIAFDILL
jgi:hypothetical protein